MVKQKIQTQKKVTEKKSRQKKKLIIFVLGLIVVVAAFIYLYFQYNKPEEITTEKIKSNLKQGELTFLDENGQAIITVLIEIAQDEYSRMYGLMFRESLPETQAMLFIFEEEKPQYFWMKNTPVSLDMIFVNANHEIVNIEKYTTPYSTRSYPSRKPAKYVIEVVAGFTDQQNIKSGNKINWKQF